jgi:hypothetical protein
MLINNLSKVKNLNKKTNDNYVVLFNLYWKGIGMWDEEKSKKCAKTSGFSLSRNRNIRVIRQSSHAHPALLKSKAVSYAKVRLNFSTLSAYVSADKKSRISENFFFSRFSRFFRTG